MICLRKLLLQHSGVTHPTAPAAYFTPKFASYGRSDPMPAQRWPNNCWGESAESSRCGQRVSAQTTMLRCDSNSRARCSNGRNYHRLASSKHPLLSWRLVNLGGFAALRTIVWFVFIAERAHGRLTVDSNSSWHLRESCTFESHLKVYIWVKTLQKIMFSVC